MPVKSTKKVVTESTPVPVEESKLDTLKKQWLQAVKKRSHAQEALAQADTEVDELVSLIWQEANKNPTEHIIEHVAEPVITDEKKSVKPKTTKSKKTEVEVEPEPEQVEEVEAPKTKKITKPKATLKKEKEL